MKKLLIIVALVLVLLVGLLASGWWWLTSTRSGAEWALNRATGVLPALSWEGLEGNLRGGLIVHQLDLEVAETRVAIDRTELAVRIHLPPGLRVEVHWLRAFDVDVRLPQATEPDAEPEPLTLPDLASPVEIHIHELLVQALALRSPDPSDQPLRIDRIQLQGRYFDILDLASLQVEMPDLEAGLSGRWGLSAPFAGDLALAAEYRLDTPEGDVRQAVEARIGGDLDALRIDLETRGPAALAGQVGIDTPLQEPAVRLDLTGRLGDWPGLDLAIEDLAMRGAGGLEAWQVDLAGAAVGPDIPANRWQFGLAGDLQTVEIRSGQVETLDGRIDLSGRAGLGDVPQAQASIELSALDLTLLYPDWPRQARLNGRFELDATPERVIVEQLSITAPPSPLELGGQARWTAENDELALALNWTELNWPPILDDSEPLLYSQSGSLNLSGTLSDWQAELDAVVRLMGQPQARVQAAAGGSESSADIHRVRVDAGAAGTMQADGAVAWAPEPSGRLELRLTGFDTGQFVDALPGQLDMDLSLAARSLDDIVIDLRRLDGSLRDQAVSGRGRLEASREASRGGELNLGFGDNRMRISSSDGQAWDVRIEADALHQIEPQASGRLNASGQVDLAQRSLHIDADLNAADWADINLDRGSVRAELNWQDERIGGLLRLNLQDLDLNPWERVDQLELAIDGDCLGHTAQLNINGQRGTVDLNARGALDQCVLADITGWAGAIEHLFIGNTLAGDWELNQALEIGVSPERITASRGCLVEAAERQGRLCLRGLEVTETGRAEIGIEQVPMDLLLVPLDPVFNLTTPLSGELEATWSQTDGLQRVAGFLALDRGALKPLGEEDSLLDIESVRIDLVPETDHLRVALEALLEGDSRLNGQAQLVDLNDLSSATIDAHARLNLPDIGVFNRLVTELDQLGGRLSGEMQLRGALLGPSLNGQLRLDDGLIVQAPLGLRIEDIELVLDGTEERAGLDGRMRGGDGELAVSGEMVLVDNQWQLEARVNGERFRFSETSWLRLSASPDIHLLRSGDGLITLDGDIRIDQLRAGLPPGAEQRVNASPDVRVRGEVEQDDPVSELAQRLQGRLAIDLGNDARTSALGMQARLAGGMELLWDRQSIEPRARGVIRIPEGSYRAYGQNLQIQDGEVVFTGHAIDNPSLNIDAVREIFGDPQVEAAGVRIRGNARDPRITLFTEPPTSEEKALAYVVTGANFDHADGQAAINVGFYLLPRLFVSYGIGLFEAGNVLSGRFELSQRWGVRVVSGERDTGVDLSFAIDR